LKNGSLYPNHDTAKSVLEEGRDSKGCQKIEESTHPDSPKKQLLERCWWCWLQAKHL